MNDNAPPPTAPLEYADKSTADAPAAHGLVYVLAAFGAAELLTLGWKYGQIWFRSLSGAPRMRIYYGSGPAATWVGHALATLTVSAAVVAVASAGLAASSRLRSARLPLLAATLLTVGAWAWQVSFAVRHAWLLRMDRGVSTFAGDLASSMAGESLRLLVPATLLWLLARRSTRAALAGGAV